MPRRKSKKIDLDFQLGEQIAKHLERLEHSKNIWDEVAQIMDCEPERVVTLFEYYTKMISRKKRASKSQKDKEKKLSVEQIDELVFSSMSSGNQKAYTQLRAVMGSAKTETPEIIVSDGENDSIVSQNHGFDFGSFDFTEEKDPGNDPKPKSKLNQRSFFSDDEDSLFAIHDTKLAQLSSRFGNSRVKKSKKNNVVNPNTD
ncbi:hypothetical protein PCE1_004469 [Barthelona sp. PCE]